MTEKNNFTALRLFAAGLVLFSHSFVFLGLSEPVILSWASLGLFAVYIFFSISGYLIAKSWSSDPHLVRFMLRRVLRIFPALIVCILLTTYVMGPLVTTLETATYLTNSQTHSYLSNIGLYITYYLPGVFANNIYPGVVNGSIWSLPVEFFFYLVLGFTGAVLPGRIICVLIAFVVVLLSTWWATAGGAPIVVYATDIRQVVICGAYFWMGVIFFRFDLFRFVSTGNVLAITILWLCLSAWARVFELASIAVLPFLTLAFGLSSGRYLSRISADYSYGVYIYAFPVQQCVAYLWPKMTMWLYLAVTGAATIFLAGLSWHFVESKCLKTKPAKRSPLPS